MGLQRHYRTAKSDSVRGYRLPACAETDRNIRSGNAGRRSPRPIYAIATDPTPSTAILATKSKAGHSWMCTRRKPAAPIQERPGCHRFVRASKSVGPMMAKAQPGINASAQPVELARDGHERENRPDSRTSGGVTAVWPYRSATGFQSERRKSEAGSTGGIHGPSTKAVWTYQDTAGQRGPGTRVPAGGQRRQRNRDVPAAIADSATPQAHSRGGKDNQALPRHVVGLASRVISPTT